MAIPYYWVDLALERLTLSYIEMLREENTGRDRKKVKKNKKLLCYPVKIRFFLSLYRRIFFLRIFKEERGFSYVRKKMLYRKGSTGNFRYQSPDGLCIIKKERISLDPVGWRKVQNFKKEF